MPAASEKKPKGKKEKKEKKAGKPEKDNQEKSIATKKKEKAKSPTSKVDAKAVESPTDYYAGLNVIKEYIDRNNCTIADFEMADTIGIGIVGRVRLAILKECSVQTPVAIKVLKKSMVLELKQVNHIRYEAEIMKLANSPFIVSYLGKLEDAKRIYFVLEFCSGGELYRRLEFENRLETLDSLFYACIVTVALEYLHGLNVIYRDLKPENLLITVSGYLKMIDFGFSKIVEGRSWTLCGTPEYLAPEMIQNRGHGVSVDWWALGVLIYEMVAGYAPFFDDNPFVLFQKVLACRLFFPKHFDSKVKDLTMKLLSVDRGKRFGCLAGGATDIARHKAFDCLDWEAVRAQTMNAPYVPELKNQWDLHMFDEYPESDATALSLTNAQQAMFRDVSTEAPKALTKDRNLSEGVLVARPRMSSETRLCHMKSFSASALADPPQRRRGKRAHPSLINAFHPGNPCFKLFNASEDDDNKNINEDGIVISSG
eukprot:GEMP01033809.1.p1 GENE.GEMP01033809.1~~GEMP01033809.1.p1  ORF type:complete len:483 (+),score=72.86 GEMP01033809.1:232-1680(+)